MTQHMLDCFENGLDVDNEYIENLDKYIDKGPRVDGKEEDIPVQVEIGVTVALCGLLLMFIPGCQPVGQTLIGLGTTLVGEGIVDRMEENRKRDRDDRKKCLTY